MGEWKGASNWYGGQIQQIMRLVKDATGYKLTLEPMEKRRSHRFARFYGSRRFLQVRVSEDLSRKENEAIRAFFLAKFILCGRVFVPFHSKDGGLYMVETDENWERESQDWCGDQFRMPFRDFINWHNPLTQKKNYVQVYILKFELAPRSYILCCRQSANIPHASHLAYQTQFQLSSLQRKTFISLKT